MDERAHEVDPETDPEALARLEASRVLREQNNAAKYRMLHEKHGVVIPREAVEADRVVFTLDYLFPPGTLGRAELELAWQDHLAEVLEKVHAEVLEKQRAERERVVVAEKKLIVPGF